MSIYSRFVFLIIVGALIFVVLPLALHESINCPKEKPASWELSGNEYLTNEAGKSYWHPFILPDQQNRTYDLKAKPEEDSVERAKPLLCEEVKATDLLIVFFTYCLVVVGWFTLRSSDDTYRRIERAYVFVSIRPGSGKCHVTFKNHGKSPAILQNFGAGLWKSDGFPPKTEVKEETNLPPGLVIGAGGEYIKDIPISVSLEDLKSINEYLINLCIYGTVKYKDILDETRETNFLWRWFPDHQEWDIANNHEWNTYT